jgi:small subunit ribosomal protein S6e
LSFKVVISDPESGKSFQIEVKDPEARRLVGMRVGEKLDGTIAGLPGYELLITGGTDRDGFPIRPGVAGSGRKSVLLGGPPAFKPRSRGERKRKRIRGSVISETITQVNTKIVKRGEKPVEEILGLKEGGAPKEGESTA